MSSDAPTQAELKALREQAHSIVEAARATHEKLLQDLLNTPANLLTHYQLHNRYQAELTVKQAERQLAELDAYLEG